MILLKNSLVVAGGATALAALLGFVVALWTTGLPRWARAWVVGLSVVALAFPPFLVTNCWLDLLGETGEWGGRVPLDIYSEAGVMWVLALMTWPITFLATQAGWARVEAAQLEVDPLLRGRLLVRHLLWPAARTMVGLGSAVTFVLGLNNFSVPAILQVKVYPAVLWLEFNTKLFDASGEYGEVLRLAWPLVAAPVVLMALWGRDRDWWPRRWGAASSRVVGERLGVAWFWGCGLVAVPVLVLAAGLPLAELLGGLGGWGELRNAFLSGRREVWNSFLFSAVGATAVTGLAVCGWRCPGGRFLWLPFLVPGVLVGFVLIVIFNRPGLQWFYQGGAIMVAALAVRYAGISWSGVAGAMRRVDRDLLDAARSGGASWWATLRHARWPQVAGTVAVVWYLTYLLCLWDVGTLVLIEAPGCRTLALQAFNLLHYQGHNSQVNGICLLLLGLGLAPWAAVGAAAACRRVWKGRGWAVSAVLSAFLGAGCGAAPAPAPASRFFSDVVVIGSRGTGPGQFNKPRSVAVDLEDNLFVADMTGRIQKFNSAGAYVKSWQMPETDKGRPKGMCRDAEGSIVVLEPHYARVNHFGPDGELKAQWGVNGTGVGELAFPRAVAVGTGGDVYVSEYGPAERVQRFAARGGRWITSLGRGGKGPGEFNRPEGLGLDPAGRLYVADSCNHRIQVFDTNGVWLRAFGRAGNAMGEMSYPYDVRVDAAGYVYVCEFGNSRVQIFDGEGRPVEILGGAGRAAGHLSNPWSMAFDSRGNLYVADAGNHRVQKFMRR